MRTSYALWLGGMLAVFALGANANAAEKKEKATHESVVKEFISIMNDAADSLGKISDKDTAEKAAAELKKGTERAKAMTKAVEGLGKPTKDEEENLKKKYDKQIKDAAMKFQQQAFGLGKKLANLPKETQTKVTQALMGFGQAITEFGQAAQKASSK